jgi:hypothetical protein
VIADFTFAIVKLRGYTPRRNVGNKTCTTPRRQFLLIGVPQEGEDCELIDTWCQAALSFLDARAAFPSCSDVRARDVPDRLVCNRLAPMSERTCFQKRLF